MFSSSALAKDKLEIVGHAPAKMSKPSALGSINMNCDLPIIETHVIGKDQPIMSPNTN